ncbi:putative secreted protein [Pseudomonas syringae pv. avii]|uniref:Secreted protein n=2 Tax=Pseudomonas syringae group TaxID=136849 RepID=A0ABY1U7M8_PSESX|nr:hypothetical protein NCPPB2254_02402 [Pseudomonas syringae pv. persicae]SOQ10246.1 hypothetical protein CFBP1573P_02992 [Pseudomonas syringae pv. persicae]SOS27232.1 putative secreted protein [Pseudomonas syringae pv. avii]
MQKISKTLILILCITGAMSGCFDNSNSEQGTKKNPNDGSSVRMEQH